MTVVRNIMEHEEESMVDLFDDLEQKGPPSYVVYVHDIKDIAVKSKDSIFLGRAKGAYINSLALTIEGIVVQSDLFKMNRFVSKDRIYAIEGTEVQLIDTYLEKIIGRPVIDKNKKKIGNVLDVIFTKKLGKIKSIIVSSLYTKENLVVFRKDIKAIGKHVLLDTVIKKR